MPWVMVDFFSHGKVQLTDGADDHQFAEKQQKVGNFVQHNNPSNRVMEWFTVIPCRQTRKGQEA